MQYNVWNNLMEDENDETNSKLEILLDSSESNNEEEEEFIVKNKDEFD